jgi:hypothetical protein
MPYKDADKQREWQRENRELTAAKRKHRREYERERKNKKRIEAYMLLPEPERSRKLEANEYRRSLSLRWQTRSYTN